MKINAQRLHEMIKEAMEEYVSEVAPQALSAADRVKAAARSTVKIPVAQLIVALQGLKKQRPLVTKDELLTLISSDPSMRPAPTGVGASAQAATPGSLGRQISSPTAGAAVRRPFESKDRKITVTQSQLKEMVTEAVKNRLMEFSTGNNPIMAKREIIALMDSTSRNFENEIIKTFNLQNPDTLSPELQRRYLEVVEGMKAELVAAAMRAVQELINFPSNDEGNAGLKK